ncbi:MAG: glutamine-hydrolyzing GMP synthase [Candidatus Parcubacteria bacterium]|nr:glutamine-hydrolyzing GMP synthase [Candidatus Parcubacteria bacterium]
MLYTLKKATPEALAQIEEEKRIRQTKEIFLLFSLGSQFDHLIKQEIEKLGVFCLVADPARVTVEDVQKVKPIGIILSGGPVSVYDTPPPFDERIFDLGIPVLGICLGFQLWAKHIGVKVVPAQKREFGTHLFTLFNRSMLFHGCPPQMSVLESHGDRVEANEKIKILGQTVNALAAAEYKHLYGVQFHPEVTETEFGPQIFKNFCFEICGAKDRYPAARFAQLKIEALRQQIGDKKVLLALSGGSDSSTCAYLLKHALQGRKGQVLAIYIKGIDRPEDEAHVLEYFGNQDWLELKVVDATEKFLAVLKGKITMREKRIAMREVYKAVLEEEAALFGASFIVQGTLYTDISESGGGYATGAQKAQIKLHHNVNLGFNVTEILPLSDCVKDSGRNIGREIGVPEVLLTRHPFPGLGMVVRIEGEVNAKNLAIARAADQIYIEELRRWKLYDTVWQAGATVEQSITTCTKGDDATSGVVICIWAVWSVNGFTARRARLSDDFLEHVAQRLSNEIREVGEVTNRLTGKPPTTIEKG